MRKHVFFVERINLADIRLGFVNTAEKHAIFFIKKRARKRRLAAGAAAEAITTPATQTILDHLLLQKKQIAALNLHFKRCYNFFINFLHRSSHKQNRVPDYKPRPACGQLLGKRRSQLEKPANPAQQSRPGSTFLGRFLGCSPCFMMIGCKLCVSAAALGKSFTESFCQLCIFTQQPPHGVTIELEKPGFVLSHNRSRTFLTGQQRHFAKEVAFTEFSNCFLTCRRNKYLNTATVDDIKIRIKGALSDNMFTGFIPALFKALSNKPAQFAVEGRQKIDTANQSD